MNLTIPAQTGAAELGEGRGGRLGVAARCHSAFVGRFAIFFREKKFKYKFPLGAEGAQTWCRCPSTPGCPRVPPKSPVCLQAPWDPLRGALSPSGGTVLPLQLVN